MFSLTGIHVHSTEIMLSIDCEIMDKQRTAKKPVLHGLRSIDHANRRTGFNKRIVSVEPSIIEQLNFSQNIELRKYIYFYVTFTSPVLFYQHWINHLSVNLITGLLTRSRKAYQIYRLPRQGFKVTTFKSPYARPNH